jgi:membrane-associated protease RseP (regulator of RpoE activity)
MKKITFLLLMSAGFFAVSNAQIAGNECEKTCEIEKVVQEGALLGVRIQGVQCGSAGVFVKEVLKNTAAERYGFQINDVIYYVDGNEIMNTKQLVDLIASHQPSDLVTVTYTRNGKEITEDVVLGAKTSKIVKETICCDDKDPFFNSLNLNLFPNPATTQVLFSMDKAEAGKYAFQVFNTAGEEVYAAVESFDAGFSKRIDVSEMADGEYFLKVTKGKQTATKAFVVSK